MVAFPTAHVPLPDLSVDGQNRVFSHAFGDVYFSRDGGADETRHVFLHANGLPERFREAPRFTIGELGFGTGLNFLVAWQAFLENSTASQHLHYLAVEQYPLTAAQLTQVHISPPPGFAALQAAYPLRLPGWHTIALERCTLTLAFGDATALLQEIDGAIDAWFLDGFAPAKNEAMWRDALLSELRRLSAPGASFATFTAAGQVRRGLEAQGFTVEKVPGFGRKRDMLKGRRMGTAAPVISREPPQSVAIIGAGVAGACLAHALAERGIATTILERGQAAGGASGNPAGVLFPQLTKHYIPSTAWHFTAYGFMLRQLRRWQAEGLSFTHAQPGMLRLPRPGQRAEDFLSLALDPAIARYVTRAEGSALAGTAVAGDGWWFPQGTWIDPTSLIRALLQHESIRLREYTPVQSLQAQGDGWKVTLASGEHMLTDAVVLAAADQTATLLPQYPLKMGLSAGQVSLLPPDAARTALRSIVSHRGYVIPLKTPGSQAGSYLLGATYERHDFSGTLTPQGHAENLRHAQAALPEWLAMPPPLASLDGRVAFRATTPDRLPYVGMLAPGLYISTGHGSRGMISAPLAAALIAAEIAGETVPLARSLRAAIAPRRWAPAEDAAPASA